MTAPSLTTLAAAVADAVPHAAAATSYGELTIEVSASEIEATLTALRDDPGLQLTTLIDICGADYPKRPQRFDVVYHLLSMRKNIRLRIRVKLAERDTIPTVIAIYPAANWFEREAFDMYGILFGGHPDLRRLLTDYGFNGHPLRKDFPLTGYVEVRYDDDQKRVVYEPVKLAQEFRNFDYLSPWEGQRNLPPLPGDEKAKA